MRKLKLQMQMSLDGFVAGPEGQLDWMSREVDDKQVQLLQELTDSMDTIILGRKMAEESVPHWEKAAKTGQDSPEKKYAETFVSTPKIVFSKTIKHIEGKNILVENGDLTESINKFKSQKGKDIIVYGGANFVNELINNNLIDELNLFIVPTAIGNGLKIFNKKTNFQFVKSISFSNGVIGTQYKKTE
jgi:dihydrofolate reductase